MFDWSGSMEWFAAQRLEWAGLSTKIAKFGFGAFSFCQIIVNCVGFSDGLGSSFLSSAVLVNQIAHLHLYVSFRTPNETCCANLQVHLSDRLRQEMEKSRGSGFCAGLDIDGPLRELSSATCYD